MAFAAGAAVTIPTLTAMGVLGYYAQHPDEQQKQQQPHANSNNNNSQQQQQEQRRPSASFPDREFILDDDPSEFSSFSSAPDTFALHAAGRRRSSTMSSSSFPGPLSGAIKPDHDLLEEPHLQVWRDRYKWGRQYGMNYAHNDR
ncbi:hypothetical protein LPJ53_005447 [Coemansia erecta]|uniref:Uncharacterized protein n=1 Tax=Coemansia erecta TaxID=147472 RepID=A0A9W7XWC3_9FUNG|nr:hypothetical protein LPJ53_005447 [Coemansia erecta]